MPKKKELSQAKVTAALNQIIKFAMTEAQAACKTISTNFELKMATILLLRLTHESINERAPSEDRFIERIRQFTAVKVLNHYPRSKSSAGQTRLLMATYVNRAADLLESRLREEIGGTYV